MARRSDARQARAPTLQESADALGAANSGIGMPGGDLADVWKAIAGLKVPAEVLLEAQRDYLVEATAIWNRLLVPGAAPSIGDRRFASPEWTGNPSGAFLAELYLLNARTLLQAGRRPSRATPRRRHGCASRCCSGSTRRRRATTSRSIPRRRRRRSRPAARASCRACTQLWNDVQQRPPFADRRERVRGRPQRRHQRGRGGVRERAVPAARVRAADGEGPRAADPVRAAVHQQVLHPRPAARELADPPHRRRGPPRLRDQLEQRRDEHRAAHLGRLHRERGARARSTSCRRSPARSRSTRWASASAARSSPRALARARGARRAAGREHDAADDLPRLQRHRRARHLHRRDRGAACAR